jgi:hypothetical protein
MSNPNAEVFDHNAGCARHWCPVAMAVAELIMLPVEMI